MPDFKILAFETSCDDTAVSIVNNSYEVLSNVVSSQIMHNDFGGIVPEIASRLHLKNIVKLTRIALQKADCDLKQIDAVAVSVNPGLIGSLLVGVSFAKSLAYALQKPVIAVNHILGHLYAAKLTYPSLIPPYLALVASGGHTEMVYFSSTENYKIIGRTRDDAAGEAFDKTAKLMGLGYPGGPIIDRLATDGNPDFYQFPRALDKKGDYDFSFSGLKTAVRNYLKKNSEDFIQKNKNHIAASLQAAIVDILIKKTLNYAAENNIHHIVIAGGVAANSRLRHLLQKNLKPDLKIYLPELQYCMDNAAMIGAAAVDKYTKKDFADYKLNAFSKKGLRIL